MSKPNEQGGNMKQGMRWAAIALTMLIVTGLAQAQNRQRDLRVSGGTISGSSQQVGSMTLYNLYSSDGTSFYGSSQRSGSLTFYNFSDNRGNYALGTTQRLEPLTFYNFSGSNGSSLSGTSLRLGSSTFYSFSYTRPRQW
jgi:hypothetical protein